MQRSNTGAGALRPRHGSAGLQAPTGWRRRVGLRLREVEAAVGQRGREGFVFNRRSFHPDLNAIGVLVVAQGDGRDGA